MAAADPDEQRAATRRMWEQTAPAWGEHAAQIRDWGMPVSAAMIDALAPQPGQRVLELACGPGDTGFMAAELLLPGGTLISSDGAEAMLEVARGRARALQIENVEFRQLELEWIDLPAAAVDGVLCRWGIMLIVDPAAAAREIRRVLRPGSRAALAVWDARELNPWATIPGRVLVELGHAEPPEPGAPGPFALGDMNAVEALLHDAGFAEVHVTAVSLERRCANVTEFLAEQVQISPSFGPVFLGLDEGARDRVVERLGQALEPFAAGDGSLVIPGRSLVAAATA